MATRIRAGQIEFSGINLNSRLSELEVFKSPVNALADLPATAKDGEQRLVKNEDVVYRFHATIPGWKAVSVTQEQAAKWSDKYSKTETDAKFVQGTHNMTVSATAPAAPATGDVWIELV